MEEQLGLPTEADALPALWTSVDSALQPVFSLRSSDTASPVSETPDALALSMDLPGLSANDVNGARVAVE